MTLPFATAADPAESSDSLRLLKENRGRLRWLAGNHDLREFSQAVHEIHLQWVRRELDNSVYSELMLQAVLHLNSGGCFDDEQNVLADHYRLMLLEGAEEFPLHVEITLLLQDTAASDRLRADSRWPAHRRRKAQRLLHGWRRLREAADPDWDPDHPDFVIQVPPPKGFKGPLIGMSRITIDDPKLRAEYERAVAENTKKWERDLVQREVRRHSERFLPRAEPKLIEMYSEAPAAARELKDLLREYLDGDPASDRMIKKVESNAKEPIR